MVSTPEMPATASSMGLTTWVSTSAGPAPRYTTVTATKGIDASGNRSVPSREMPNSPSTTSNIDIMVVKTGRWIDRSERVMACL